jgi:hypothetical protein
MGNKMLASLLDLQCMNMHRFYIITADAIPRKVCLSSFNPSTNTRKSHQSIKTF